MPSPAASAWEFKGIKTPTNSSSGATGQGMRTMRVRSRNLDRLI